jgi:hypothetical protein
MSANSSPFLLSESEFSEFVNFQNYAHLSILETFCEFLNSGNSDSDK